MNNPSRVIPALFTKTLIFEYFSTTFATPSLTASAFVTSNLNAYELLPSFFNSSTVAFAASVFPT